MTSSRSDSNSSANDMSPYQKIETGAIDPSFVITHRAILADAPEAYKTFRDKNDGCIKVVLLP